jgi:hypothetical protein
MTCVCGTQVNCLAWLFSRRSKNSCGHIFSRGVVREHYRSPFRALRCSGNKGLPVFRKRVDYFLVFSPCEVRAIAILRQQIETSRFQII